MSEKLDDFSKILLATGTINYMASALNGVVDDYGHLIPALKAKGEQFSVSIHEESHKEQKEMLSEVVTKLNAVIEDLGNFLDARDIVCALDSRVYEAPLRILLHGEDDTEADYDDVQEADQ